MLAGLGSRTMLTIKSIRNWNGALNRFAIEFEGRFPL
jgi:hypothetical protein